jgi:rhamnosyltransferase
VISVVVPVKDGGEDLVRCLEGIRAQLLDDEVEVVVIDSGSSDGSVARARALGAVVHQIDPREFDHGATRNLGAAMARGEVLVFTSQDAHAEDEHWLARLVAPLRGDESLAGVYGRQLAHPAARPAEQWFLDFLYGPRSRTQRLQDGDQRGVSMETTLFSNANSAIRRAVWERFPFAENVIMSEDQEWSRRVLLAGHALRYEAQAVVRHSHDYSLAAAFRRFFDSGVSASRSYMGGAAAGGALRRRILAYGRGELSWLVRKGHVRAIPQTIVYELAKLAGLVLGLNHERLPARLRPRLSALPGYWEREAGAGDRQGECRICGAALGPARLRGRDRLLGEPGEFSVHECPRCGVAATLPRLGAHEVARFYPERYQPHGAPTGRLAGVLALARRLQLDLRLRRRPFSAILAGGPGRVLDVGCGRG